MELPNMNLIKVIRYGTHRIGVYNSMFGYVITIDDRTLPYDHDITLDENIWIAKYHCDDIDNATRLLTINND